MHWYLVLLIQYVALFATSRYVLHTLWHRMHTLTKSTSVSFYLLSIIYLPGTLVHELSHLCTSVLLFVRPHSISLIPSIEDKDDIFHLRFGFVQHEKTDFLRSAIIGLSPIVAGGLFFYIIYMYRLFPASTWYYSVILIYLFFSIGSTMFPSKADLKEVPIVVLCCIAGIVCIFLFNIDVQPYFESMRAIQAAHTANIFLLPASIVNGVLAAIFLITRRKS